MHLRSQSLLRRICYSKTQATFIRKLCAVYCTRKKYCSVELHHSTHSSNVYYATHSTYPGYKCGPFHFPFSREFKNRLQIFRYHSINCVSVFNSTIEFTSSVITCTYHFTTWLELHFACSFFVLCTKAIQNFKTDRLHQSCSLRTRLEFVCELAGDWH